MPRKKHKMLQQLCLFDPAAMARMVVMPAKAVPTARRSRPYEVAIQAMQDCMSDGNYDGPETPEELCKLFGFI